eukprot:1261578-Amphidinium_carterae.1
MQFAQNYGIHLAVCRRRFIAAKTQICHRLLLQTLNHQPERVQCSCSPQLSSKASDPLSILQFRHYIYIVPNHDVDCIYSPVLAAAAGLVPAAIY